MKIYTKSGDGGNTCSLNQKILSKGDMSLEVIGTFDELNASLAFSHQSHLKKIRSIVLEVQKDLFYINSKLSGSLIEFDYEDRVKWLEGNINDLQKSVKPINKFVIPTGSHQACYLNLSRTICRRAERKLVTMCKGDKKYSGVLKYTNRLSDLLFVMYRYTNSKVGVKEILWNHEEI